MQAIDLALWLVWKRMTRQASNGIRIENIDDIPRATLLKIAKTKYVSIGNHNGELRVFATRPSMRLVVKWLHDGFDDFGRPIPPFWSGRLRRRYGVERDADIDHEMKTIIK